MCINSPLFLKAVATLAKQQNPTSANTVTAGPSTTTTGKRRAASADTGMSLSFLVSFRLFSFCFSYSDRLASLISPTDFTMVLRARNVTADAIIAEIAREDPLGQTEFENIVRHQVVAFSQRIHISLLVLDKLMDIYNTALPFKK